ncbi:MAG: 3-phosphoshikimate 1-carboxyvinyltransferase [Rhodospirillaceae bacterium]|nr:3-phosphoshikimate 1-carboxyvinyltransferase [Rhodospirillaceae bacterium]
MSAVVQPARPLLAAKGNPLRGAIRVPGDKSISHRALIMGALAVGETVITGLLEGDDVLRTASVMRALGAKVERLAAGQDVTWHVWGRGVGGLSEPDDILDMGNSGTGARLIAGLLAAYPFTSVMTGDASLRRRPMNRVIKPLSQTGAAFYSRAGGMLPMTIVGARMPAPLHYDSPIASAQVKSAVLLAGLHAPGATTVTEPAASRDHTERMFRHFGVNVECGPIALGSEKYKVTIIGQPELSGRPVVVPGDPSSAAFPMVAALLIPGSEILIENVGLNPLRIGLFDTLREMGASLEIINQRLDAGEPVADIKVKASVLRGINVPPTRAPSMIDEYPILAIAAACADGETRMEGLAELRVKESDRLAAMVNGLVACGVDARAEGDTMIVRGTGKPPKGHATIAVNLDHRIAMAFLVLGQVSADPIAIDDVAAIATSFPDFVPLMSKLGATLQLT